MANRYLIIFIFFIAESLFAKNYVDCSIVLGGISECNPYESKFLKAKSLQYDTDKKELITSKTMPTPKEFKMNLFSVEDLIERYIKIDAPLRFSLPLEKNIEIQKNKINKIDKKISVSKKIYVRYGKYTVSTGDRFHSIAKSFDISTKELLRINLMDKKSKLKIGQKLRVPLEQNLIDARVKGEYIIRSGDSLHTIAKKFKIKSKELEKVNNITSQTLIKVGKKLKLPYFDTQKKNKLVKSKSSKKPKKKVKVVKRSKRKKSQPMGTLSIFGKRNLRVTATAYSSHVNQTDSTPFLAAWNNRLRPGMKIIAVSRDMLTQYGLRNGTKVRIGGLKGYYTVRDKMNKRYKKRIDIYMGVNRRRALRWGRRSVMLYW